MFIDSDLAAVCEHGTRIIIQHGNAMFEKVGGNWIIMSLPFEVPASRQFDSDVEAACRA
jgi:hypothetical protein